MKISFQNVNSINDEKTEILANKLTTNDLLCLSELNKCYDFNKTNNLYQYHTDVNTKRIGILASNTLKITPVSCGLNLSQERVQKDKTVIQSFLYKISVDNRDIYIENIYSVPDASDENIDKLISHLQKQQLLYRYYLVGGDFNLNWKDYKTREKFKILHLTQLVKDYTRVVDYKKYDKKLKIFKRQDSKVSH